MKDFQELIDFIRSIYKEPSDFIPLHAPVFNGNEKKYINDCIETTLVSSVGKYVDRFEDMIAEYTGAKKAIVTVNGTNAIHLALLVSGVESGDEVITQPLTFIATANAIAYAGAKPIFVDVDRDTMGMSPDSLREWLMANTIKQINKSTNQPETISKITKKRIASIVPMHTFGHPCRIEEIVEIANEFNIPVIEDAAESLGSFYKGQHTGTFAKLGVLSFNGNKTITTGGGGMILTNDVELGNHIKHLTTQSKIPHTWEYDHDNIGYNYRMPNINAALGVAQMENLDDYLENKRQTTKKYKSFLENTSIQFVDEPLESKANFWLNSILLKDRDQRNAFLQFSNDRLVMTRPIWKLMNKLEMFKKCQTGNLSNSIYLEDRIVNIPSSVKIQT